MVKILVIGDLHGAMPKIHFKNFDCIVQVGDVCGDKDFRNYSKKLMDLFKKTGETLDFEEFILSEVGKSGFKKMKNDSLKIGREILKYLNSFGKPVFFVPGNWDQSYGETKIKDMEKSEYHYFKAFLDFWAGKKTNEKLIRGLKNIYDCQFRSYSFLGFNIIGYGLTSAPEGVSGRLNKYGLSEGEKIKILKSYSKIENKLNDLFRVRDKKIPTIFLSHNIIWGTKLDLCWDKESPAYKKHLGSDLGEKLCNKYNVSLAIGGHVHDNFGKAKVKNTFVINAGFGKYVNILIDLDLEMKKIKRIEFWDPKKQYDPQGRMKKLLK